MKTLSASIVVLFFILFTNMAYGQNKRKALRGSGVLIKKSLNYKNFDKVSLLDFNGKIDIEIGRPFSVELTIDDNLEKYLVSYFNEKENMIELAFEGNKNNKLYIEDTNIMLKICMPEASVVKHRGNTSVSIHNITGRYFRLEQNGNGNVTMTGTIDELDIDREGNGDVLAKNLIALTANIKTKGNGDVKVFVNKSLKAMGVGNGNVIKYGPGIIEGLSGIVGNGELISKN